MKILKEKIIELVESIFSNEDSSVCCSFWDEEKIYEDIDGNLFLEKPQAFFYYNNCYGKIADWLNEDEYKKILYKYGYIYADMGDSVYNKEGLTNLYEEYKNEYDEERILSIEKFMRKEQINKI